MKRKNKKKHHLGHPQSPQLAHIPIPNLITYKRQPPAMSSSAAPSRLDVRCRQQDLTADRTWPRHPLRVSSSPAPPRDLLPGAPELPPPNPLWISTAPRSRIPSRRRQISSSLPPPLLFLIFIAVTVTLRWISRRWDALPPPGALPHRRHLKNYGMHFFRIFLKLILV
jgi:hypothetical protein